MSVDLSSVVTLDVIRVPGRITRASAARPETGGTVRQNRPDSGKMLPDAPADGQQEITAAVSQLQDYIQSISRNLEFAVDSELNRIIVTVYNPATNEVIRQIPAEEVLNIARHLREREGVILDVMA